VSKAALQAIYEAAKALRNPANLYTSASWSELQSALTVAKQRLGSASATQAQVDAALTRLTEAISGLNLTDKRPVSIKLNQSQVRIVAGKSFRVYEGVYFGAGLKASYKGSATWKSSNPRVATVDANGKITAHKRGKVTITATTNERGTAGKKLSAKVTVKVVAKKSKAKVTKVSAAVPKSLRVGAFADITGKYKSAKATGVKVKYKSSNAKVATIDKAGRIVAKAKGVVKITVQARNKKVTYRVTIR
jgi:uncharacterized protein YjdB